MRRQVGGSIGVCLTVICLACIAPSAKGEVLEITGSSSATVIQFTGIIPLQSDIGQALVPLTVPEPPAISTALIDNLNPGGQEIASGQCLAVFDKPEFSGLANPNDVGLDLGAFSDDGFSSWFVEGIVRETRSLVFNANETSDEAVGLGNRVTSQSRVVISGVLVLTGSNLGQDLTGAESRISIELVKRQEGELPLTLMQGEVVFAGGPNGEVSISSATGPFAGVLFSIEDFSNAIPAVPLAAIVPFRGLVLPYEYEYIIGQPFDLDLTVISQVRTRSDGSGAASVFGALPTGLPSVFDRVKEDDRGNQLADLINAAVDTTGAAYVGGGPQVPNLFPFCGFLGVETLGVAMVSCLLISGRRLRRCRRTGVA